MTNTLVTISPDFTIYDSTVETATTSTARYALPIDSNNTNLWTTLLLTNMDASTHIHFKIGDSTVIATTDSTPILAGNSMVISRNGKTHIAILVGTGTADIAVTVGDYGTR